MGMETTVSKILEDARQALNYEHDIEAYEEAIRRVKADKSLTPREKEAMLGELCTQRNLLERKIRHNTAALFNEFDFDKRGFRSMVVGYYVDDNGLATDKEGHALGEEYQGQFLDKCPEKLVEAPKFFAVREPGDSEEVCLISQSNVYAVKEILANIEPYIRDNGVLSLYLRLSAVPGHYLGRFRYTIDKALRHSGFDFGKDAFSDMTMATSKISRATLRAAKKQEKHYKKK